MNTIELIGWGGTFFYLIAYLLLVLDRIQSTGYAYHILNVLGAIGLIVNAIYLKDTPNIVVNVVWLIIATFAVSSIVKKKTRKD